MKSSSNRISGILTSIVFIILGTFLFSALVEAQNKNAPPNIVFIICDQMRGDAFGAAGNSNARTPNIDRLAANGVMLRNNFVNNPVCIPSRISMFSGLYPNQTGILCNQSKGDKLSFNNSLPWYLKNAGYSIAYIGKNHTYENEAFQNFDFVSIRDREEFRAYSIYVPPSWHSDVLWPEEDCNPGKNTREAIEFINQSSPDKPFFLTVNYFDPHPPYMAPSEYTSRYCSEDMVVPEYIDPELLGTRLAEHQKALHYDKIPMTDLTETMRYYHASVEWGVDYQIGKILETLEKNGIVDNTIIVFTSDHGDFMGEHHMVRKGMFHYDALLHVPMIWHAPGLINKAFSVDNMTQNVDIFPTLLDFAGVDIPDHLAGRSIKDILQGKVAVDDEFIVFAAAEYSDLPEGYWEHPEPYFNPDEPKPFHSRVENLTWKPELKTVMARNRNWKLILSETHEPELYKMDGGYIERENLYGKPEYDAVFQTLKAEIDKRWTW